MGNLIVGASEAQEERRMTGAQACRVVLGAAFSSILLAGGAGCVAEEPDHQRFVEVIPQGSEVAVAGPDSASAGTNTQTFDGPQAHAQGEGLPQGPWAESYALTRSVRDGVNHLTADILGSVWWLVTEVPPTNVSADEATWGPYDDALKPSLMRFRVKALGGDVYEYTLEGRPKAQPDADYLSVMTGLGYGRAHAEHRNGQFRIDLDAARALDPFEHQDDGTGVLFLQHWLAGDTHRIIADHHESADAKFWTAESIELPDGTGTLFIDALDDMEDSATPALETITLASRWRADGAGRADYSFVGGDVAEKIEAAECWDPSFYATYFEAGSYVEGDGESCAFAASVARP